MRDAGVDQRRGFGALAEDGLVIIGRRWPRINDGDLVMQTQRVEFADNGPTEVTIATHNPAACRRHWHFRDRRFRHARQAFRELKPRRVTYRQCQASRIQRVGIDDKVGAERLHIRRDGSMFGPGNDRNSRIE